MIDIKVQLDFANLLVGVAEFGYTFIMLVLFLFWAMWCLTGCCRCWNQFLKCSSLLAFAHYHYYFLSCSGSCTRAGCWIFVYHLNSFEIYLPSHSYFELIAFGISGNLQLLAVGPCSSELPLAVRKCNWALPRYHWVDWEISLQLVVIGVFWDRCVESVYSLRRQTVCGLYCSSCSCFCFLGGDRERSRLGLRRWGLGAGRFCNNFDQSLGQKCFFRQRICFFVGVLSIWSCWCCLCNYLISNQVYLSFLRKGLLFNLHLGNWFWRRSIAYSSPGGRRRVRVVVGLSLHSSWNFAESVTNRLASEFLRSPRRADVGHRFCFGGCCRCGYGGGGTGFRSGCFDGRRAGCRFSRLGLASIPWRLDAQICLPGELVSCFCFADLFLMFGRCCERWAVRPGGLVIPLFIVEGQGQNRLRLFSWAFVRISFWQIPLSLSQEVSSHASASDFEWQKYLGLRTEYQFTLHISYDSFSAD